MTISLLDLLNLDDDCDEEMPRLFTQSPYISNEEALEIMSQQKNKFSLLSLNIQSLLSKHDQLQSYMYYFNHSYSVICLQETWLSSLHDVSILKIDGYQFIHKPKSVSQHGGVGFYINDALDFTILSTVVNDDLCDSLFVEFIIKLPCTYQTYKIILGNIYRPPRQSVENYSAFITSLEQTLESFENINNVILVGDFNIDLLKIRQNEHANSFFETLLSNGYIPTITQPTRITDYSKTLIDNCFIKCFDNSPVTNSAILLQNISDHQPYLTCFDYSIQTKPAPKFIKTQTKSPKAIENLKNELKITCNLPASASKRTCNHTVLCSN